MSFQLWTSKATTHVFLTKCSNQFVETRPFVATTQSRAVLWLKQDSWTCFFLICSWSLPEKGTMPVISTMKKRTSSSSSGPVEKKLQKQSEGLHLKNALKSHFPKGVTEMDFCG